MCAGLGDHYLVSWVPTYKFLPGSKRPGTRLFLDGIAISYQTSVNNARSLRSRDGPGIDCDLGEDADLVTGSRKLKLEEYLAKVDIPCPRLLYWRTAYIWHLH